jgi:hypothetical protein
MTMGDRANIVIVQHPHPPIKGKPPLVYFYSHWGGHQLPATLQKALRRKERWSDESYLARIIFCGMVEGYEKEPTSFGIATYLCDNEYPLLVVDAEKQTVSAAPASAPFEPFRTVSFEEYCALDEDEVECFRDGGPSRA